MENVENQEIRNQVLLFKGRVLTVCAFLEHTICLFLSVHYGKNESKKLLDDVFENDFFQFELKKRIFYTALKAYPDVDKVFPKRDLDSLQELRNLAAHSTLAGKWSVANKSVTIFLRHKGKDHSYSEQMAKFAALQNSLHPIITTLPGIKSEAVLPEKDILS